MREHCGPHRDLSLLRAECQAATYRTMLTKIPNLPSTVIGFEVSGKLEAEDYRDTLRPAVQAAAEAGDIRIVIVMPKYEGISGGALWQDLKMGVADWRAWKRIALVTDVEWMIHGAQWFGWMTPGEVKQFPVSEQADAIAWAAS
jgi:hypothetical protein